MRVATTCSAHYVCTFVPVPLPLNFILPIPPRTNTDTHIIVISQVAVG